MQSIYRIINYYIIIISFLIIIISLHKFVTYGHEGQGFISLAGYDLGRIMKVTGSGLEYRLSVHTEPAMTIGLATVQGPADAPLY